LDEKLHLKDPVLVKLESVTKIFNPHGVNEVTALSRVSLHVPAGQFLMIIGGNGSGKSTLLNLVAGAYLADEGKIFVSGEDFSSVPEHRRAKIIGRVFQDPLMGTAAGLTIEENFALASCRGKFRGLGMGLGSKLREEIRERLALLKMGLENRLNSKVALLSGGQRQAITMLMAVFRRPKVLLLDEHTAALDPRASCQIMELTLSIVAEEHLTTLMVTHNLTHVLDGGDRAVVMNRGTIVDDLDSVQLKGLKIQDLMSLFIETA
jgi:putative tryptophan/tyrosine transport system ATP-binding protein